MRLDPHVAFNFEVTEVGASSPGAAAGFREVSGLEAEIDTELVTDGGENQFVHRLPKGVRHSNLMMKLGVATASGWLVTWCKDVLEGGLQQEIETKDITISLLNEESTPVAQWTIADAYPVRWTVGLSDTTGEGLAIESIEFAYTTIARNV